MSHQFSVALINWYEKNKRDLPWRATRDPYKIWLSEIILQQTRVAQGRPYYEKFIASFPTIFDLAAADEQQVLRLWQGLGYYSRARNLHACAKEIVSAHEGNFPQTAEALKKLKGIGDYTAAAIASFAFGEASPVLDGNVFRVASRYFGIASDIANPKSKKDFYPVLNEVIDKKRPDLFNQAIMEYGALHCTTAKPLCLYCELQQSCFAFQNQQQDQLPVKIKKIKVKARHFNYMVFVHRNKVYLKERGKKDIWQGLHDFYLLEQAETGEVLDIEQIFNKDQLSKITLIDESDNFKHILTHQRITARFYVIRISEENAFSEFLSDLNPRSVEEVSELPKPKLIDNYLNQVFFSLAL